MKPEFHVEMEFRKEISMKSKSKEVTKIVAAYMRIGNILQLDTMTVTEAATYLGISKDEMKKKVDEGEFQKVGDNGHRYVLLDSEVKKYKSE